MRRAEAAVGESTEETRLGRALGAAGFTNKQLSENTAQGEEKRVMCLQNWKMEEPHCVSCSPEVKLVLTPALNALSSEEPLGLAERLVSLRTDIPATFRTLIISAEVALGSQLQTKQPHCLQSLSFQSILETIPRLIFLRTQPSSCTFLFKNQKWLPAIQGRPSHYYNPNP